MNLIIVSEHNDVSTNDSVDWFYYQNKLLNIIRLNNLYSDNKILLHLCNRIQKNENSFSYWYRRGNFIIDDANTFFSYKNVEQKKSMFIYFDKYPFFFNRINKFEDNSLNKLIALSFASIFKILIPETYVITDTANLASLQTGKIVTKEYLDTNRSFIYNNKFKVYFDTRTQFVDFSIFNKKIKFDSSLFQCYIQKKYEIRTFYLKGKFKSMAIFSQQNEKTKTDFRNYDNERPNRCVPYNLPKTLEIKLHKLMLKLDINCGSMDIIVTPDDEYYFLEVNPIGQFQWLSKNCNYFIERMIANDLAS